MWWCAYFDSKDAYHITHKEAQKKASRMAFMGQLMAMMKTGDPMQDMQGGYMGPILHLERERTAKESNFAILIKIACTSPEAALQLVQMHKKNAYVMLTSSRGTCVRISIFLPGGDAPDSADNVVHILEQWTNEEDYESFIVMPGRSPTPSPALLPFINDRLSDVQVLNFGKNMKHYKR